MRHAVARFLLLGALLWPAVAVADGFQLAPDAIPHFNDNSGNPCVGCLLFTYGAGTTTKQTTFVNSTGSIAQTNPIVLNSRGEPQNSLGASVGIWATESQNYKYVLAPQGDSDPPSTPIWTIDNVPGSALFGVTAGGVLNGTYPNPGFASSTGTGAVVLNTSPSIVSPTLSGTPTAPTAGGGNNTAQVATTAFVQAALPVGANPTATAGNVAVNGSASTFMRSDGAPAIAISTPSVYGVVKPDNATIADTAGVLSTTAITVAGATCTNGGSCAPAASGLSNGVTGSGLIVLTTAPLIQGAWVLDDSTGTFSNLVGGTASNASACFAATTGTTAITRTVGATCIPSDERLKGDFDHGVPGLSAIMQLRPGYFSWADAKMAKEQGRQLGLGAQSVAKIFPEIVTAGGSDTITLADGTQRTVDNIERLDYGKLVAPLIVAVQEQQNEIRWLSMGILISFCVAVAAVVRRRRIA